MNSNFGGEYFSSTHESDCPELTTRLRRRVRAKRGCREVNSPQRPICITDVVLLLTVLLLFSGLCFGQSTFETSEGTVQDGRGLVIPEASVTIHSLAENTDLKGVTDSSGGFNFESLKSGLYTITIRHESGCLIDAARRSAGI